MVADLATNNQFAPAGVENGLDGGEGLAGSDEISRGAGAEEQSDRLDQNGFPGARLPRQHIEPRFELDLDGFDHRQVADAEETQHARGTAIVSYV